jgi:hypothetical protein
MILFWILYFRWLFIWIYEYYILNSPLDIPVSSELLLWIPAMFIVTIYGLICYWLVFKFIHKIQLSNISFFVFSLILWNIMFYWQFSFIYNNYEISNILWTSVLILSFPIGFLISWWIMKFFWKNNLSSRSIATMHSESPTRNSQTGR